jgi:hypothetical protein
MTTLTWTELAILLRTSRAFLLGDETYVYLELMPSDFPPPDPDLNPKGYAVHIHSHNGLYCLVREENNPTVSAEGPDVWLNAHNGGTPIKLTCFVHHQAERLAAEIKREARAKAERKLLVDREEAAATALEEYDFGDFVVTDQDGWTRDGIFWSKKVYGDSPEGPDLLSFLVQFKPGNAGITEALTQRIAR